MTVTLNLVECSDSSISYGLLALDIDDTVVKSDRDKISYAEGLVLSAKELLEGDEWQVDDLISLLPKSLNPRLYSADRYVPI